MMEYFRENFVSATEQIEPVGTKLTGELPEWLRGSLLRVGPGKFDFGDFSLNHWLDGLAILYKFSFESGKVKFRKRYLQSDSYKKAVHAKRPIYTEFGTKAYPDPSKGLFSRMLSNFDPSQMTDNGAGSVFVVDDEVFVATETCFLRRIDPNNLDTKEKIDLHKVAGVNFASSHPITDLDGTTYNIGSSFTSGPKYHIFRVPPSADSPTRGEPWMKTKSIATIGSSWKASYSYIHSFAVTANYIVYVEQPLLVNTFKLATAGVKGRNLHECLEWHPQEKSRFHVVCKRTGEILKTKYISDEPFFTMHHVNAYEVKDQIVVDLIAYKSTEIIHKFYLKKLRSNQFNTEDPPQLTRFVLPLIDEIQDLVEGQEHVRVPGCLASAYRYSDNQRGDYIKLEGVTIGEAGFDMPCINKEYTCRPYRFVYGSGGYEQGYFKNMLCKVDVETGHTLTWKESEFHYPGEPVYVHNPNGTEEDDGVILVAVGDCRPDYPDIMVILDAKDLREIARAEVNSKIPHAMHGTFLRDRF